jgi:hypothetical protein
MLTNVALGKDVTYIGQNAFYQCDGLTEMVIDGENVSIDYQAFYNCENLQFVSLNGVTNMANEAFIYCYSLEKVVIGDNTTVIGYRAFYHCSKLKTVTIGKNVTTIGGEAFVRATLKSVYYGGTAEDWAAISIGSSNSELTSAPVYFYSENEPALNAEGTAYEGLYWRYVDGVETPWVYTNA